MVSQLLISLLLFITGYGSRLAFELNKDQAPADVRYILETEQYRLYFKRAEMLVHVGTEDLRIQFAGNLNRRVPEGAGRLDNLVRYVQADDQDKTVHVPKFASVRYESLYTGIDFTCYGRGGQLQCDFAVMAGGDPNDITITINDAGRLDVDPAGSLIIESAGQTVRLPRPVAFQLDRGQRSPVDIGYRVSGHDITFVVGTYARGIPLIIATGTRRAP